jgi:hypothetical protein
VILLDAEVQEEHLGKIADSMSEWKGPIADGLKLKESDIAEIETKHEKKLNLQM